MVLHGAVDCLTVQTFHVSSDHRHLLSYADYLTAESDFGADWNSLEVGNVQGASDATHELPLYDGQYGQRRTPG